ncbi:MAG: VOC family protein [Acetobacteraceae bacterium]|nr:MAG: VOC family protein [Acetobacteraceae bacterium]
MGADGRSFHPCGRPASPVGGPDRRAGGAHQPSRHPAVTSQISAIALVVPEYDPALAFYVGTLGFRLVEDIDQGHKRWVLVEPSGGGVRLVLARAEGAAQTAAIGNQAGGRVFLFLSTDDFARDHASMLAAGVVFEEAPRHESYGSVAVWRDPFGNRWDLIGPPVAR